MKVLVTGATGFVGRYVVPQLLERGHAVVAVARNKQKAEALPWYDEVRFLPRDLHQPIDDPMRLFEQPNAVIHLAWSGLPNYQSLFHLDENLPADYGFLSGLINAGLRQLLVTGTCLEYGMLNGCLVEDTLTQPTNPYGLAKDTLRKLLQALQQQRPYTLQWARLFYMYGPGQNPDSLLAQLDRAIDSGDPQFNMSSGEQLRDYLPVDEVAARLVALIEHPQCNGIFNVCSGRSISVRRLVENHIATRRAGIRLNLGHYPYPDHEPMAFWGDATKLSSALDA